jgi:hypothetical protein
VNRLAALLALTLAACFNPTFDNPTCGPNGECPSGTTCEQTICREMTDEIDAPPGTDATDAAIDTPIDAPSDGVIDGPPIDGTPQCAAGDLQSPDEPTRCFRKLPNQRPWQGARSDCQALGGDLTDIRSGQENMLVRNLASSENQGVWLGGTDQMIEMEWRWVNTNMAIMGGAFIAWGPGEPNGALGVEDCMRMDMIGEWFDSDCNATTRRAICVVPPL